MSYQIAERIKRHAEAMGLTVRMDASNLSDSYYLQITRYAGDDEDYEFRGDVRVRISSHEARPTYERLHGYADYEVGDHPMSMGDWLGCVVWLAKKFELPLPPAVRAAQTRRETLSRKREAERQDRVRVEHQRLTDERESIRQALATDPEAARLHEELVGFGLAGLSGKARRKGKDRAGHTRARLLMRLNDLTGLDPMTLGSHVSWNGF